MTMRRRSPRRRSGSGRQRVTWQNDALRFTLGSTGTPVFFDITPEPMKGGDPRHGTATCKRIILSANLNQIALVDNVPQSMALGIYVLTQEAITATTILGPLDVGQDIQDWYYWTARTTFRDAGTGDGNAQVNWEVDIKTQRRLRGGYGMVVVAAADTDNTVSMLLTLGIRSLWAKTA